MSRDVHGKLHSSILIFGIMTSSCHFGKVMEPSNECVYMCVHV